MPKRKRDGEQKPRKRRPNRAERISKYEGVYWRKGRWMAHLYVNQDWKYGGQYPDELTAAKAVNGLCQKNNVPLKNPGVGIHHYVSKVPRSKFIGVDYVNIGNGKWCASLTVGARKEFVGVYKSERRAAKAVNDECRNRAMKIKNPEVENDLVDEGISKSESSEYESESLQENSVNYPVNANSSTKTLRDHFMDEIQSLRQQVVFYKQALKTSEARAKRMKEDES